MFKVEKNIPISKDERGPKGPYKYPWNKMEIGDSFFVGNIETPTNLYSIASWTGRRHDMKFTVRKVNGGFRVWRIE